MTKHALTLAGILGSLALASCSLDIPDLNNPGLEQLENSPTTASINTATTGMLIGARAGKATTAGLVNQLGILGREAYDFDSADGRFVNELIQGNLSKASPFGGAFWGGNYANIRLGNIILHGVDKVPEFSDAQRAGIRGFVHTITAFELLTVIWTHRETGAVIDTDHALGEALGDFVSQAEVYAEINRLLDLAAMELGSAGMTFTFSFSPGFAGFNTPLNFLKFNRALKARVAVNTKAYQAAIDALAGSFINDAAMASLTAGPTHPYSTAAGDVANALINTNIYAHQSLLNDVQMGTAVDARYTAKIDTIKVMDKPATVTYPTDSSLTTTIKFKIYTNVSPIPIIRNEELILIKAEALWFTGDKAGAMTALNFVRVNSGKLTAIGEPADNTAFVDALLYERRYSLMYEFGHRWNDLIRFGRPLPLDDAKHTRNVRFPVPQAECDARPGEPACMINSSDPVN
jgi:starch-binding outer membrane protein, SusD/RagB family